MPFNELGLWTPDVTVGQAPLAGLEMQNTLQSLQNFRQAQATKREQALLEMLKAGRETGVDVSASPTSQEFGKTMGLAPGEASGLYHQLPEQKFAEAYRSLSPEDQKNPDVVDRLALATGYKEQPWYSQQRRNAIAQQRADTAAQAEKDKAKHYTDQRIAALQRGITASIEKNRKMFDSPQAAARSAVDQALSRGDLTPDMIDKLNEWVGTLPAKWPEESEVGVGLKKTKAQAAQASATAAQTTALTKPKADLLKSQTDVNKARETYLNAAAAKAGTMSDVAKRNAAQAYYKTALAHADNLRKSLATPDEIAAADRDVDKAKQAIVSLGTSKLKPGPNSPTAAAVPKGLVALRQTTLPDGPAPNDPSYYASGGTLYGPPQTTAE